MNEELSRHKEALKVAIGALRELGLDYAHFTETVEKRVAAVLEPPEEMVDEEIVRWMCGECGAIYRNEGDAAARCCESVATCEKQHIKLTGTVKRPIRRAVIREYEVAAKVTLTGDAEAIDHAYPFHNQPECHGKAGVLIFRTAE